MAFAHKRQPLYDLHPDIAVIPECSKNDLEPRLFDRFDTRWFGDNPRKGLGVLVAKPLRIIRAEKPPNRWVVPLSISGGPCDFRLIAVWAMPVKGSVVRSYIGQVYEAIANHPQWFHNKPSTPSRCSGDFTSPPFVDAQCTGDFTSPPFVDARCSGDFTSPAFVDARCSGDFTSPAFVDARCSGDFTSPALVEAGLQPSGSPRGTAIPGCAPFSSDFRFSNSDSLSPVPPDSSPAATIAHPKPVILCGDFNSNKIWDDHRKAGNHSGVVSLLEKRGLLSAYHHFFSEPQGQESRPTYYFWHRKNRGYHIDYVFLPRAWASCIQSVQVGLHSDWSHLSDHVPLSVEVSLPPS